MTFPAALLSHHDGPDLVRESLDAGASLCHDALGATARVPREVDSFRDGDRFQRRC